MRYLVSLASLLFVGCASQIPVEPLSSEAPSAATLVAQVPSTQTLETASLEDPAKGRICKTTKRPGSNIADTVCYTREEQLARQDASKDTMNELQREARWRDQAIHDAISRGRFPTGAGIGPR